MNSQTMTIAPLAMPSSVRQRIMTSGLVGGVALLWLLPFVWTEHRFPLPALDAELASAICLALALLCCAFLARADMQVGWRLPAVLTLLVAIGFVHLALGHLAYAVQSGRLALFIVPVLLAYLLGRQIIAADLVHDATGALAMAAIAGGVYSVLIQWFQLFDFEWIPKSLAIVGSDPMIRYRPFANIGQPNHLATYLGIASLCVLYWQGRSPRAWMAQALALLFLASGLAITGARMGILYGLLLLAALIAPTALRPSAKRVALTFAGALVLGYLFGIEAARSIGGSADTVARLGQDTLPIRFELWRQALQISVQHPILGIGFGEFGAGELWNAGGGYVLPANNCHNLFLQLAAEFGWPAAVAGVALTAGWFLGDWKQRLATPHAALAIGVLALLGIHSMLEFPLWHLYFAAPAAMMFAIGEPRRGLFTLGDTRRVFAMAGVAVIGVVVALISEFDPIVVAGAPILLEARHQRERVAEDSYGILITADSRLFRPEAERFLLELKHPDDEKTDGPLLRTGRVLQMLPAPEIMSQRIVLLAKAGRIDEAVALAQRLAIFSGSALDLHRNWILEQTRDLGAPVAPLRRAVRDMQAPTGARTPAKSAA